MPVLNIAAYRFVRIADGDAVAARVRDLCEERALKGSVLVAPEGINLFLAGDGQGIDSFLQALAEDPRFADLAVKYSDSDSVPFRRLRVKNKPEIITFRDASLQPESGRAPTVEPMVLREWLRRGRDEAGRDIVLLDTRNAQEAAHGSFAGALSLPIDKFTDLPEALETHRDSLRGKTIVSFCTGGIRCEKAALWMQQAGYENVLQLEGGILGYFEQVGGEGYEGDCFVFDERIALDPQLRPSRRIDEAAA
ncbi:sulfurtransferase [Arenimonas sp.]|uniref:sulfurtransferase n=1 Tax=Arenimonas sp. TaxID=1872635 RepID=UPI0039E44583